MQNRKNNSAITETEIFVVCDLKAHRSYPVTGRRGQSLETVWRSQKSWFMEGNEIQITGEDGRSEVFVNGK